MDFSIVMSNADSGAHRDTPTWMRPRKECGQVVNQRKVDQREIMARLWCTDLWMGVGTSSPRVNTDPQKWNRMGMRTHIETRGALRQGISRCLFFIGFVLDPYSLNRKDIAASNHLKRNCVKSKVYTVWTPLRGWVYLPLLRQRLLETKHQLWFLNEHRSLRFSSSKLPAPQNRAVHSPQLGSEPRAPGDFSEGFVIGLLLWNLDQDEEWAQGYLETVHV